MIEYEYSYIVDSTALYIKYCIENEYEKVAQSYQIRELYTNSQKILARITTETIKGKTLAILDFKDENDSDAVLKTARETIPLNITEDNQESIYSIIAILGFQKSKVLKRNRVVYQKDEVKFEIDEYLEPDKQYVVAIEGIKQLLIRFMKR